MARRDALRAPVLQGGGALGAYEFGVARVLYGDATPKPDLIAGVSVGAITAALLARPRNGDPLSALEEFWRRVALPADFLPPAFRPYAAANRGYITVPNVIEITRAKPADGHSSGDFSPATIAELVRQGAEDARAALALNDEGARPVSSRAFDEL